MKTVCGMCPTLALKPQRICVINKFGYCTVIVVFRGEDTTESNLHVSSFDCGCNEYVLLIGLLDLKIRKNLYVFTRVSKVVKSDYQLRRVCASVRMEKLDSHWTDFDEV